eukprot:TRINITY_DN515_c0_g1_i1.p1 TRINITY_DN515_c0_g1~~TRINITY_DN515_c0_g1_i1.p1  ORF type:complete len:369 (+),score=128.90 TRINITY_DN515_c0_g1_i1:1043-2149(+)
MSEGPVASDVPEATEQAVFRQIRARFPAINAPLLHGQLSELAGRPYQGLTIVHNVPLTLSTLLKLECLRVSGAEVVVTLPIFVDSDPQAIELLKRTSFRFVPRHEDLRGLVCDVTLDVCAELAEYVSPRLGAVELTQTGDVKFRAMPDLSYPVVSVDDCRIKRLEDAVGAADGFMRAMDHLVREPLGGRTYVIFGYGKVGVGIAFRLSKLPGNTIVVVDNNATVVARAQRHGHQAILASDVASVEAAVDSAFCVVTCTGVRNVVSRSYRHEPFAGKCLANVGTEDEFGDKFEPSEVLFAKRPINFSLEEPTTIQYLDPAFYAHNKAIELFLGDRAPLPKGVTPFPRDFDEDILLRWSTHHQQDLPDFS